MKTPALVKTKTAKACCLTLPLPSWIHIRRHREQHQNFCHCACVLISARNALSILVPRATRLNFQDHMTKSEVGLWRREFVCQSAKITGPGTETSILPPLNFLLQEAIAKIAANTPFLRSKNSHFQNEAKCKTFLVKMKFICTRLKSIFISIGFALSLALKQRLGATRKWLFVLTHLYPSSFFKDLSKYGWKI